MAESGEGLRKAAHSALVQCMAVSRGESVLVITDEELREVGYAFWEEARELGAEAIIVEMVARSQDGEEPPQPIARIMSAVDVVIAPTSKSLSHTLARQEANAAGARIASMPGITKDSMIRTLTVDYSRIAGLSEKVAHIMSVGKSARITAPRGTDITMSLEGRKSQPDTGIYHMSGDFGNLPAGEAFIAPVEGTAEGMLVVDGAMSGVGALEDAIHMKVEAGYVTEITGGPGARILEESIAHLGKPARNIAELGVGTNDRAIITGKVLEDEKVLGTVHIALGKNVGFGGTCDVPVHLDGIILQPTLVVDDIVVIRDGVLQVKERC
ncbi:MAG: aminopeptidase [Firmicutes bacterium]|nr:aminopeptidase [Bacillota bacterium]